MDQAPTTVTDGGIETDLIFRRGFELPDFAAYPLLDSEHGRAALLAYFTDYCRIAGLAGARLRLETPTWRANPDWAARLGHDAHDLARFQHAAVELLLTLAEQCSGGDLPTPTEITVSGMLGPRGDGYRPGAAIDPDEAADYHRPQLAALQAAGAQAATALTLTDVAEAIGVARAAADVALPLLIGFTVETDGRLPDGTTLGQAVRAVDEACTPAAYLVNCAHPSHVGAGLASPGPGGEEGWRRRVTGVRVNASRASHAELDESVTLDDGDPVALAAEVRVLCGLLPAIDLVGGCCGTDARHVAAMWDVEVPS